MSRAKDEVLDALHGALASEFLKRIAEGSATAADLSAARQFLKDNAVSAVAVPDSPLGTLVANLPFAAGGDEDFTH